eukprot:CAMPEP_0114560238 /NCGR_PEP_ID=MMETSP0114-20121206/11354_1 /TAXON_ID=31324 /ORGANISM="Goniomonas sp, Strain m" /LENGTH=483 /DNA_ID=CAMNT_0001745773 /DNA_START=76 /DNA_END=1527 /DNA_ORIENTATION=+
MGDETTDEKTSLIGSKKVVPQRYDGDEAPDNAVDQFDHTPPTNVFYFVTSWILFVEGVSGLSGLAVSFFYKNTLGVSPALLTSISSVSSIPWAMKPVFGFISDGFPIFGYRRKPYIFLAGVLGGVSWFLMSTVVADPWSGAFFLLLTSTGICVGNVISEALVVEKSRGKDQEFASKLQSIIWGAQAVGSVLASWTGGWLLTVMTDRNVFLIAAVFPLTWVLLALITPDKKLENQANEPKLDFKEKCTVLFQAVSRPEIAYPCAFIFMLNATPATGASWFFFYTDVLHFDSEFMGTINLIGSLCTLAGVILFQQFLKNQQFRGILLWSTIISTLLGLSQLLLIFRLNHKMGIPDGVFCLGESAILSVVGWINTMPILVLAARLCPKGMEGTMYAFIMSVNNFGGIVGSQIGALLTIALGVTEKNLSNFWLLVLICNASTVLPLVFINWIPRDDPMEVKAPKVKVDDDPESGAVAPGTEVHYQDL